MVYHFSLRFLMLAILLFSVTLCSRAQLTFQKVYSDSTGILTRSVDKSSDGGFIISAQNSTDIILLKTDSAGTPEWFNRYHSGYRNFPVSAKQTPDGGFIVAGLIDSLISIPDIFLMKTDAAGNILWTQVYSGTMNFGQEAYDLLLTPDSGFVILGITKGFPPGDNYVYLIKTDSAGNVTWTSSFGHFYDSYEPAAILQLPGGGFIVAGHVLVNTLPQFNLDIFLSALDPAGNLLWTKTYNFSQDEKAFALVRTPGNGFVIAGLKYVNSVTLPDIVVLKTDSAGDVQWSRIMTGPMPDIACSVSCDASGAISLSGTSGNYIILAKLNASGTFQWAKYYGNSLGYHQDGRHLRAGVKDYLVAGATDGFTGSYSIYLVRSDSAGNSGCFQNNISFVVTAPVINAVTFNPLTYSGFQMAAPPVFSVTPIGNAVTNCISYTGIRDFVHDESTVYLYPNPASGKVFISVQLPGIRQLAVFIDDITGKNLLQEVVSLPACLSIAEMDISCLSQGFYTVRIAAGNFIFSRKLVKL